MADNSSQSLWETVRRSHLTRSLVLYLGASYALLETADIFTDQFGLPDWFFRGALILLIVGLPVVITTALMHGRAQRRRGSLERGYAAGEGTGQGADVKEAPGSERAVQHAGAGPWLSWRKVIAGLVVAFAVWGLVVTAYMGMRALGIGPVGSLVAAGVLDERERVLVAEFEDHTEDPLLAQAATEAFRIDLRQSPIVTVVDPTAVDEALTMMGRDPNQPLSLELAREVAVREGIKAVIAGEVWPVGTGFALYGRLVSAEGHELAAYRETASDSTEIIAAIDRLSKRMRERIGESLKSIRSNEPLDQVTTSSLEALRKYSQAVRVIEAGDNERGIALLEEAVALDTAFAMAYRKLGVALQNMGREPERAREALTRAYEHRERLTDRERYLTLGTYYSGVTGDTDKARTAYESLLDAYPDDPWALNNLAIILLDSRDYRTAESLFERAVQVDSGGTLYYGNAITSEVALGKFDEAERTLEALREKSPDNPTTALTASELASARFDYPAAEEHLQRLHQAQRASDFWQMALAFNLAPIDEVQGRLEDAEVHLRQAMAIAERSEDYGPYLNAAVRIALHDALIRGKPDRAKQTVTEALDRHPLTEISPMERPYVLLATFYALVEQTDRAREMIKAAEQRGEGVEFDAKYGGKVADGILSLVQGQPQRALTQFRAADDGPCAICILPLLGLAYDAAGASDSVIAVYERYVNTPWLYRLNAADWYALPAIYERLAGLYQLHGEVDQARRYYARFIELWKDADPDLQDRVESARRALGALSETTTSS